MNRSPLLRFRILGAFGLIGALWTLAGPAAAAPAKPKAARPVAAGPRAATHEEKRSFRGAIALEAKGARACYDADVARSKRKGLRGIVTLRFVVDGRGRVTEAGPVHNTTRSRYLADCLVRLVEKIRFPAPATARGAIGSHAFRFPPE